MSEHFDKIKEIVIDKLGVEEVKDFISTKSLLDKV